MVKILRYRYNGKDVEEHIASSSIMFAGHGRRIGSSPALRFPKL
jgi:hypothetical protein